MRAAHDWVMHASPLPHPLDARAFAVSEAVAVGVTRGRLRASDLDAPYSGVRTQAPPRTVVDRARAYAPRMHADHAFSHATAAALVGLPLPWEFEHSPQLHVASRSRTTVPRGIGLTGHFCEHPAVEYAGLMVIEPVCVWTQLATVVALDALVAAGDALVRRQGPLARIDDLEREVVRMSGARGARRLRQALALVRPGTDSPKETELRLIIMRAGLPEPDVNPRLTLADGTFLAFGDLVFAAHKLIVEYDGAHHFATPEAARADVERIERLVDAGWRVLRFNKTHLAAPGLVAAKVRRTLIERGWRL